MSHTAPTASPALEGPALDGAVTAPDATAGTGRRPPLAGPGRPTARLRSLGDRLGRGDRIALAVLVGAPLLVFTIPALAGYPLLTGDDVIQNYPLRAFAGAVLRHGHLPLYDPFDWSGSPLLGGINAGAAYPAVALFAVLPALAAWVATDVLAFAGVAVGLYAFLRLGRCRPLAAGLGAAAFGLGGFVSSQAVHIDVVETCAALAWLLVGFERCAHGARSARPGWITLAAASAACLGLAGSPEVAFYAALGAACYGGHLVLHAAGDGAAGDGAAGGRVRLACTLAFACALGVALAAVQLLPGAYMVDASQRAKVGESFLVSGALAGSQFFTLLAPHVLGGGPVGLRPYVGNYNLAEIDAYAGILALVATASLATRWRAPDAWRWRVWYLVGAVGLVIALGDVTPVPALLAHVPIIDSSRLPSRALVLYALASSVLLAYWAEHLLALEHGDGHDHAGSRFGSRAERRAALLGAFPPVAVVVLLAAVAIGGEPVARFLAGDPLHVWSVGAVAPYLVLAGAIACATGAFSLLAPRLAARRRAHWLLGVALADLLLFTADQSSLAPIYASALAQPNPLSRQLAHLTGPTGRYLVVDSGRSGGIGLDNLGAPDLDTLSEQRSAQGYGSLVWAPYAQATGTHGQDVVSPSAVAGRTFDALDVTTLLATSSAFTAPAGRRPPGITLDGSPVARYFGASVQVRAVELAPEGGGAGVEGAGAAGGSGAAALGYLARGLRLLDRHGATLTALTARPTTVTRGPNGSVTVRFATPVRASGILLDPPPGAGRSAVRVAVTLAGGARFSPTGPLASAATPPHWRLDGTLGPYAVLRNTRASSAYSVMPAAPATRSGDSRSGPQVRQVSSSPYVATTTVAVDAATPFTLVRSVADIPGWSARLVRPTGSAPLALRRDGLVQSVALPAGRYDVTFSYDPPGLRLGLLASGAGLVVLCALVACWVLAERRASLAR